MQPKKLRLIADLGISVAVCRSIIEQDNKRSGSEIEVEVREHSRLPEGFCQVVGEQQPVMFVIGAVANAGHEALYHVKINEETVKPPKKVKRSAIEFSTTAYEFAHGSAPRGRGSWIFGVSKHPDMNDPKQVFWAPSNMTLTEAKQWCRNALSTSGWDDVPSVLHVLS